MTKKVILITGASSGIGKESATKLAKPLMILRKYVSDRMFDRIVMSQVKSMSN